MYHEFFGLKEPAFSIAVNPRYLYMSQQHREALAHLVYGIQNGGFVMLTGEVGTGKTTIIRCLLEQLPANTDMAIILNPMASAPELLSTICDELGVSYIDDELTIKNLTDALNYFLLENHRKGRKTVLLIDEAQLLKVPVLEQIRLLTNLETTTEKLLQIILVGQPELKKLLARPALRQLSQRITARFHLEALSLAETQAYIAHRLHVAGMSPALRPFPPQIIKKIHEFSGGIPRLINVLCERLLLGAYAKNQHQVDNQVFKLAAKEVAGTNSAQVQEESDKQVRAWLHLAFIACILVAMALVWRFIPSESPALELQAQAEPASASSSPLAQADISLPLQSVASGSVPAREPVGETESPKLDILDHGWRDLTQAQLALLDYMGVLDPNQTNPCALAEKQAFACERAHLGSWDELSDINRPALLTLVTPDKKWIYVLLVALGENQVGVRYKSETFYLSWAQLVELWNGDILYSWSRPAEFKGSLQLGDKGDIVTWVAEQFARLDKQPAPLTRQYFNDKLERRVEFFQSSQRIVPDGIFGAQTLRRLNEALGVDKILIRLKDEPVVTQDSQLVQAQEAN